MTEHSLSLRGVQSLFRSIREHAKNFAVDNSALTPRQLSTELPVEAWHEDVLASFPSVKGLCFMTSNKEIQEEMAHLKKLWHQFNKRKRVLELSEAKQGIDADARVSIDLEEVMQRMDQIEERYHILQKHLD